MVRYRPEAGERGYTFRLVNNGNSNNGEGVSPTGTLMSDHSTSTLDSSVYKERIDSLFRQQHLRRHTSENHKTLIEEEDDAAVDEPTMEHLQLHFQKVLAEQRGSVVAAPSPAPSSKNHSTTYIQVNNHVNHIVNRESTAQSRAQRFNEARNAVQAQIEKMFQDASSSNGQATKAALIHHVPVPPPPAPLTESVININHKAVINVRSDHPVPSTKVHSKQNVPLPPIPSSATTNTTTSVPSPPSPEVSNTNQYKVDYLGSLSLPGRATSLESLQFPLKELYSQYRHQQGNKGNNIYSGTMEISPAGLKIQYYSSDSRRSVPKEILNPFPTIAVWAAVKFVARSEPGGRKFAFLPLICDPENQDKQNLFHPLSPADDGEWVTSPTFHPPLFTCVMRNTQAPKNLECHAFVCDNPEDAIVIAANLYQALLRNMKSNETQQQQQQQQQPPPPPQQKPPPPPTSATPVNKIAQPIYSPSTSVSNWSESSVTSSFTQPVRPPRRKKSSKIVDGGLERRKSIRRSQNKTRSSQGKANLRRSMRSASQRSAGRVKRSVSERQLGEILTDALDRPDQNSNGDILTKVAIPRSKSFMTVPQQNYSFSELFEELKKHEGVKSVDDVLKTIVNRDRMSFNDLTPAYKEMLMKLALTLSKDEMFQRSKNIMRHQTSNLSKTKSKAKADITRNGTNKSAGRDSDAEHSTSSSRISSVLRATKKSFSKWGAARSASTGYSVTKEEKQASEPQLIKNIKIKSPEPSVIAVAPLVIPVKHFNPKTPLPPRSVVANNKIGAGSVSKAPDYSASCSECGYDSESCSHKCYCSFSETHSQDATDYSDAEKCYCSLKRISKSSGAPVYRIRLDSDDTDTSHDSLPEPAIKTHIKPTKNRQNYARKSASMTSWSALSGAESPLTAWRRNTANLQHSAPATTTKASVHASSNRFTPSSASSLRQKSLSSYLSDTSLDSDVVAMTEPAHHKPSKSSSFAKQPEILRRKSRSSYLSSETEMDSLTNSSTSCNSFVRGPVSISSQQQRQQRKTSPAESVGYQSYDSTGSSGRTSRNFSLENLSSVSEGRRNSNSSSDRSLKSQNSSGRGVGGGGGNKFLMVSAVDPKGKVVYRGTSSAGSTHHSQHHHRSITKAVPEGALSAKKTTEIAAMFSNIKLNQTTDIVIDDSEATEDTASELSTDDAYSSMHFRGANRNNKNGFSKSLENSLGYLP